MIYIYIHVYTHTSCPDAVRSGEANIKPKRYNEHLRYSDSATTTTTTTTTNHDKTNNCDTAIQRYSDTAIHQTKAIQEHRGVNIQRTTYVCRLNRLMLLVSLHGMCMLVIEVFDCCWVPCWFRFLFHPNNVYSECRGKHGKGAFNH